jgi:hypothetical protein
MSLLDHAAVPAVMSVGYAHRIMQIHIECPVSICPVKRQAKATLIEAKKFVPDSNRTEAY